MEGRANKKPYYYFSGISKGFSKGILPLGYHSTKPSQADRFCDLLDCYIHNGDGLVLPCGHAYHSECFAKINLQCLYCFEYLSKSITELSASYNERLEMDNDIDNEFNFDKDKAAQENEVNIA